MQDWVADDPYNAAGLFASVTVAPASSYALDEELSIDEGLLVRWPGRENAELLAKDGRHRASLCISKLTRSAAVC